MDKKIRTLLIVHPHLTFYGGAEILLAHLTKEFIKQGIKIKLITLSLSNECKKRFDPDVHFILPNSKTIYKLRSTGIIAALGLIWEIFILKKLVKQKAFCSDLINVHNFPATWGINKSYGKPIVWTCNEPPALWNNPNPSIILRFVVKIGSLFDKKKVKKHITKIIVSDENNYNRIIKLYGIKSEIINYGVDYEFFSQQVTSNVREKYKLQDKVVLLHVGIFSPQKNQLQSVRVLKKVKDKIPNIKLVFAGKGENDYELKVLKLIENYSLHENVIFLGHVDREKIRDLYQASDVALFPTKSQGGWLSPFEAISSGIPIVVSPDLTAAYIIEKNNLGFVSENFVNTVLKILDDVEGVKKNCLIAKQWVKNHLTWEKYAKRTLEVFSKQV